MTTPVKPPLRTPNRSRGAEKHIDAVISARRAELEEIQAKNKHLLNSISSRASEKSHSKAPGSRRTPLSTERMHEVLAVWGASNSDIQKELGEEMGHEPHRTPEKPPVSAAKSVMSTARKSAQSPWKMHSQMLKHAKDEAEEARASERKAREMYELLVEEVRSTVASVEQSQHQDFNELQGSLGDLSQGSKALRSMVTALERRHNDFAESSEQSMVTLEKSLREQLDEVTRMSQQIRTEHQASAKAIGNILKDEVQTVKESVTSRSVIVVAILSSLVAFTIGIIVQSPLGFMVMGGGVGFDYRLTY